MPHQLSAQRAARISRLRWISTPKAWFSRDFDRYVSECSHCRQLTEEDGSSLLSGTSSWTKLEIRSPKSDRRSPKSASSAAPAAAPARRTQASPPLGGRRARISDFGLLSDFAFRPSDFPPAQIPPKTANNQEA